MLFPRIPLLAGLCLALCGALSASAATIVFQGSNDLPTTGYQTGVTYIRSNEVNRNFGANTTFIVGRATGGTAGTLRGLLSFDLSAIEAGSTITSIKLELYRSVDSSSNVDGDISMELYALTGSFVEGTTTTSTTSQATWNHRGTGAWTTAGGDFTTLLSSSLMNPEEDINQQLETFDTTAAWVAAAQAAVDGGTGNTTLSMLMKMDAASEAQTSSRRAFFFYSDDQTALNTVFSPRLTIEYTPVPEPSGLVLASMALTSFTVLARRRRRRRHCPSS